MSEDRIELDPEIDVEIEDAVAVVGMACRLPGASDPEALWALLRDGVEGIRPLDADQLRAAGVDPAVPGHVAVAAAVEDLELFDAAFFGFSPREAEVTDPQQRLFLECAWEALESAGYDPRAYDGTIGVYAGANMSSYLFELFAHPAAMEAVGRYRTMLGNDKDHLPTMVSYRLDLRGPSINVQTACSTSLVAVHLACQSLLDGECTMALAGGAALAARQDTGYTYQPGGIYSPDGHCRPFAAGPHGTVPGNGVGVVVLKPLAAALKDGDPVRAVILGSAINNDGAAKVGYTAPSVGGQVRVISEALAVAGIDPATIGYIEAHGTGTELGDPIEVTALREAFEGTGAIERSGALEGRCALGSIKSNLGHLDAAAGVTGLIKTVLALEHGEVPPSLHFDTPNPKIDFGPRLYVNDRLAPWPTLGDAPRRAGVSSFGIGGTNAHAVLQQAPARRPSGPSRAAQVLVLSARSEAALDAAAGRLAAALRRDLAAGTEEHRLADVAYTQAVGRAPFAHRRALVCRDLEDAARQLEASSGKKAAAAGPNPTAGPRRRATAFLFPGQGAQFAGMARQLYAAEAGFRERLDRCLEILGEPLAGRLRHALLDDGEPTQTEPTQAEAAQTEPTQAETAQTELAQTELAQTELAQPALFAVEHSLAGLWLEWGVRPEAMLGHSVGEYVAACLAGVFSLEEALAVVAARGRLMAAAPPGAMLSVPLGEEELRAYLSRPDLGGEVELAVVNGPRRTVAAGPAEPVAALATALAADGVEARPLHTSHAFHTAMMEPVLEPFRQHLRGLELRAPRIPFLSNVTGTWIRPEEAVDPEYWVAQLRRPVRFGDGLGALLAKVDGILLEVGPGSTLSSLARTAGGGDAPPVALSSMPHPRQPARHDEHLLGTLGRLWAAGGAVDWPAVYGREQRRRAVLPTYPFERRRHWVEAPPEPLPAVATESQRLTHDAAPTQPPMASTEVPMPDSAHPDSAVSDSARSMRRDRILAGLLGVVEELTGLTADQVSLDANFLEVGLDSLMLIRATEEIDKLFGVRVSVVQLFEETNTLERLLDYLDEHVAPDALPALATQAPAAPTPAAPAPVAQAPVAQAPVAQAPATQAPAAASTPMAAAPVFAPMASGSGVENLVQQQLWLMQQQLDLLRGAASAPTAPPVAPPAAPAAVPTPAAAPAPAPVAAAAPAAPAPPRKAAAPVATTSAGGDDKNEAPPAYGPYQPIVLGSTEGLSERQQDYLRTFMEAYSRRTAESKRRTQIHRATLADSRGTIGFRRLWKEIVYPILGERAAGSKIWDVDGNEYVDVSLGFGLHFFGHSPDFVVDALRQQLDKSIALGPQSDIAGEVSALVCELTGLDRAMFCNSGTESVMGALRAARVYRRRDKVVIFNGCYHGWSDGTLARSVERDGERVSVPVASGVAPGAVADVMVLEYDDPESLEIIRRHADELAAVMVEPVPSRRPDLQPRDFLLKLRQLTRETGVLLIFDEMVTGFRVAPGGAQEWFGIDADLATYGKLVAGGLPIGVIAGKAPYMDVFDGGDWSFGDDSYPKSQKILFSGAFFKHPLTMAALRATMQRIKDAGPELHRELNQRVALLTERLDAYFREQRVPIHTVRYGPLFRFVFDPQLQFTELFTHHLVHHGVFYTAETGNCFLSTAHTAEDEDRIVEAVRKTVEGMRRGGLWPDDPEGGGGGGGGRGATVGQSAASSASPASAALSASGGGGGASAALRVEGPVAGASGTGVVDFGLYYFGHYEAAYRRDKYDLIIDSARFADRHGFSAVLFPERHFDPVGGFSPNPSVVAAGLARETERIQLRAGSVVLPLHHPIRVAEEWAVVDNLSGGRVGISFASGWHHNDFVFRPDGYARRHELMMEGIETVRALWRGEAVRVQGGGEDELDVRLHPLPSRADLPIWLTATSEDTFRRAASIGAGVLTNLLGQPLPELRERIRVYRQALAEQGRDPASGKVTVLLHTLVGDDADAMREAAFEPFRAYMASSLSLVRKQARSEGRKVELEGLSPEGVAEFVDATARRLMKTSTLIGSPESCRALVDELSAAGVDEIACFIDFGVAPAVALAGLPALDRLRAFYAGDRAAPAPPRSGGVPEGRARAPVAEKTVTEKSVTAPMASGQRGLWVLAQMGDDASRAYNESVAFHLRGGFDARAMERALQRVVDRHESLRTTFDADGEHQVIQPSLTVELPCQDLRRLPAQEREKTLRRWLEEQALETFDLEAGPLVRTRLARVEDDYYVLAFTTHHIVIDGHSFGVVLRELAAVYSALAEGGEPVLPEPEPFRDFLERVDADGGEAARQRSEAYWLERFADGVPALELPTDRPRPPVQTFRGDRLRFPLDAQLYAAVKTSGRRSGSTLYMVLLTAFKVLLHRLTGQRDLVVGVDAVDKLSIDAAALVGFAVNPLPLRCRLSGNPTFGELLAATKRQVLEGYEHQRYSFGHLVQALDLLHQDRSRPMLYAASFNMDNVGAMTLPGLEVEVVNNPPRAARFELGFNVMDSGSDILLECELNTDLFDRSTVWRWLAGYRTLLEAVARGEEPRVLDLPLLPASARHQLEVEWNDHQRPYPLARQTFLDLFHDRVEERSRAVAAACQGETLTYRQLERRTTAAARSLRGAGVGPGTVVALLAERGLDFLVAVLGVLEAGGAYLPLDPRHPAARWVQIVERSGSPVALAAGELREPLESALGELAAEKRPRLLVLRELEIEPAESKLSAVDPEGAMAVAGPGDLAYVIYTSGSTGVPKGVMVEHRGMLNHLLAKIEDLGLGTADVVAQTASQCFDISVWQLLAPLAVGGRLEIFPDEVAHDAERLLEALAQRRVTVFETVPSLLRVLLEQAGDATSGARLPRLRWLLSTGEALSAELCGEWLERFPAVPLVNAYGPTECSDDVTHDVLAAPVAGGGVQPTLGRPIANTRLYVVDGRRRPQPLGVVGELLAAGAGVGRGYLGDPARTAAAFLPDAWSEMPGARLYRTGDLVRALPDGRLEFLGRVDHQVKVRGHRIELGEIEAVLAGHPAVAQGAVLLRPAATGGEQLVGYAVPREGAVLEADDLEAFARRHLPGYMVPAAWVVLQEMPLNTSGKIDRKALPEPEARAAGGAGSEGPRAGGRPVEELVAGVWAEILRRPAVAPGDDFFELGGHSLLATQAVSRLRALFGIELSLRELFEAPTPAGMARRVEAARRHGRGPVPPLRPVPRTGDLPLSFAQQRLWFFEQLEQSPGTYSLPEALRLEGPLEVAALAGSFEDLARRHEVLRTTFEERDGTPHLRIAAEPSTRLPVVDLAALPAIPREALLESLAAREAVRAFDLVHGPLMRAALLRLGPERHALLFTMHHIVSDGWSVALLVREVAELYAARLTGRPPRLPKLPVQYADFAAWQRGWLRGEVLDRELAHWKAQLAGAPPLLELPLDRPRPPVQDFEGAFHAFSLAPELTAALAELGRRRGVTLFMSLLALYQTLLHLDSGQEDVLVGTPVAGRTTVEAEGLVGFFASMLVLRGRFAGDPTFEEVLDAARQVTLDAFSHQDLPLDKLVEELRVERSLAYSPLFQASFTFDNVPRDAMDVEGLSFEPVETPVQRTPYDLNLIVGRVEPTLEAALQYRTALFDTTTIATMAGRLQELARRVVAEPTVRLGELRRELRRSSDEQNLEQRKQRKSDLRSKLLKSLRSA